MNNAKVSVCIAVYNVEKYIEQCVRSLFGQTLDDLEYVFVDDASPDASIDVMLRVLEEYPHRKNQVKLIRHEHNQGVAVTRKDAIAAATGEYIIHCDPDDWVELDMYETLYREISQSNADMVYCWSAEEYTDKRKITEIPELSPEKMICYIIETLTFGGLFDKMYRRKFYNDPTNIYLPNLCIMEDTFLNIQMLKKCSNVRRIPKDFYHYRRDLESSLTSKPMNINMINSFVAVYSKLEKIMTSPEECDILDNKKNSLLLTILQNDFLPAKTWHSLWKNAKYKLLWRRGYPIKLKCIFYLACLNYPFAVWLWRKIRECKK